MFTQYLDIMPESLRNFCYAADRFYLPQRESMNHWTHFKVYAQSCFSKEVSDPYEQLLKAAIEQDIDRIITLSTQLNVAQFPFIIDAIRSMLREPTLEASHDAPLWKLYAAPHLIQTKRINVNQLYSLINTFPQHADNLLLDALIANTPVKWDHILRTGQYGGFACMASMKQSVNVAQAAIDCYHEHKTFGNLISLALASPDTFEEIIVAHPNIAERFEALAIIGQAAILSKIAHQLFEVRFTDTHDAMKLMFNEQVNTRQPFLDKGNHTWFSYDPVHTKQLCNEMPDNRPLAQFKPLITQSTGKAIPYLKIVEAIYAAC